jgi:hypothetical protein
MVRRGAREPSCPSRPPPPACTCARTYALVRDALSLSLCVCGQSITEYNGASVVAMRGRQCVAIAADLRLGVRGQTVATNFQKIFPMGDRLYLGLAGLATDVQTLSVPNHAHTYGRTSALV